MKSRIKYLIIAVFIAAGLLFWLYHRSTRTLPIQQLGHMQIKSSAFDDNQPIPAKYTCDGDNINPPLTFSDIPAATKSLALIVDDPDAPAGIWIHWLVWNINPQTTTLDENSVPPNSVQGTSSFGATHYGGPCPPFGTHRYRFKLYALDTPLDLPATAGLKDLETSFTGHILSQTQLTGLYHH